MKSQTKTEPEPPLLSPPGSSSVGPAGVTGTTGVGVGVGFSSGVPISSVSSYINFGLKSAAAILPIPTYK